MLSDSCAGLAGPITPAYEPVSKLAWEVEYQMRMLGINVHLKSLFDCDVCG